MGSRVVAIIPARYESSRLPGKPLAIIHGKPMVQHVYERTAEAAGVDRVIVATDDRRIFAAVQSFGGQAQMTRSSHPSGTDRAAEVAADLDAAIVVNVQGDLPFLDPGMVSAALAPFDGDDTLPMSTLKTPIRDEDEWRNPNVVKVVTGISGDALYFSRSPIPHRRDGGAAAILGYRHIGLYVYRRDFLLTFSRLNPTPLERAEKLEQLRALEHGFRIKVAEIEGASIEVDTVQDLERARALPASEGEGDGE